MAKSDMKEDTKMDMAQDKAMVKKAFKMHDKQEHKGSKTNLDALRKGGKIKKMAAGGVTKDMPTAKEMGSLNLKKGGKAEVKMCGGGKMKKMARGGGIESKGKTKGRFV